MHIELNDGKVVEFDEIAARARVHAAFDRIEVMLHGIKDEALQAEEQVKRDVKGSYFALSQPSFEFHELAREMDRHLRNLKFWRDDYPIDGTNPWG